MQISHNFYPVNGISLHVAEAGSPDGEVLMFLHGFPECWYAWTAQLEYFAARGYHVVAPDQRGYNTSAKPRPVAAYRVGELVSDIAALARQLTSKKITLAGHDWGGVIAWHIAAQYPELLRQLVIINMPHPAVMKQTLRRNLHQLIKSWYIGFFQLPYLPEWASRAWDCAWLEQTLLNTSNPGTFPRADIETYKTAWKQPGALRATINWYRAYVRHKKSAPEPGKITVPTLIIWGKKDRFLSHTMAQPSAGMCTRGRLVMIDDATHWVHHEKAAAVNELVLGFMGE